MEQSGNCKQIDGEALLDSFKPQSTSNFPLYIKSVWKDLSRRSDNSDKGFCKVIFSNYYELPGLISTRLFNLMDKDGDGYLSYGEFSKGMTTLFNSSISDFMEFVFNLFDENKDGWVSSEDIRTIFQYIPLQKRSLNEHSFQDRLQSQEELYDIISTLFKDKSKIDYSEFSNHTIKENSTIFLFFAVFLLSNKPFSDRTLTFYQKDNSNDIHRSNTADKKPIYMASPNLHSKFSPSISILHSPIMKQERDELKKEIISKFGIDENKLCKNQTGSTSGDTLNLNTNIVHNKTSDFVTESKGNYDRENIYLDIINSNASNKSLLGPSRQYIYLNDQVFGTDGSSTFNPEEILEALESIIESPIQEEICNEGYLIKLVDDKMKKLWFTLYEKYLYCKLNYIIFRL